MSLPQALARPLIAGIFVYGGLDSFRRPAPKTGAAAKVVAPVEEATGYDFEQLVRANGAAQVLAGAALALGILPRPAACVLAASLVPTTLAGHRFWEADEGTRAQQTIHFLKNASMFGGLVFAATSTGGRPSVPWRARRALRRASESAGETLARLNPTN